MTQVWVPSKGTVLPEPTIDAASLTVFVCIKQTLMSVHMLKVPSTSSHTIVGAHENTEHTWSTLEDGM